MPKRIPTPEPGDDEPKYFTVVQPYPLNANWELPHDYITFGRWIAGCIGPEPFFALFYKPSVRFTSFSARVGRSFSRSTETIPHPERLLGEHRWSEFLKKPSAEEAGRVSQIFYCVYSTGRQAQKDGSMSPTQWFKNWSPTNPIIQNPYPPTSWCPLPAEDRTNKPMCRPLPVSLHPPPPTKVAPPPVVPGSATWVTSKGAPPQNTPAALRGAWTAARGGKQPNATATNTRDAKAKGTTATAPKSSNTVPLAAASTAVPAFPPGLAPLPGESEFDFPAPPGITRGPASAASSASSAGAPLPVVASAQYDHVRGVTEGFVSISLSPSQEAHLYGAGAETSPDPNTYVAEWEKMPAPDVDSLWGFKAQKEEVVESLWGEEDDVEKKQADAILCTVHGIICKKGICKEYARLLREKERAEKDAAARGGGRNKANTGNKANNNNGGRKTSNNFNNGGKKKSGGWNDDDSSSATGSEGRAAPKAAAKDGWATVRGGR
ncbi:hypothetical protein FB451DRAFT_1258686 [Mycena latifolia]|nr:hypothetical protein FB451DRAFT_1258686 [Mycena latifolia]